MSKMRGGLDVVGFGFFLCFVLFSGCVYLLSRRSCLHSCLCDAVRSINVVVVIIVITTIIGITAVFHHHHPWLGRAWGGL